MERVKGKRLRLLVTVGACAVMALWSLVGAARMHPATAQSPNPPNGGCYPGNEFTLDMSGEGNPGDGPGAFSASGNFPRLSYPGGMEVQTLNGTTRQNVNNVSLTFDETVLGNNSTDFATPSAGSMAGKIKIVIDLGGGRFIGFSGNCNFEAQVIQEDDPTNSAVEAEWEGFVSGMPGQDQAPGNQGRAVASITVSSNGDGTYTVNIGIELGRNCFEEVFGPAQNDSIEIGLGGGTGLAQAYRTQGTRTAGRWGFPNGFGPDCVPLAPARPRANVHPAGPAHDPGDPDLPPRRHR